MKWSTALPADDDTCVGCGCPCPGAPGSFAGAAVVSGLGSPPSAARRSSRDLPALRTALSRVSNSDPVASVACFSSAIAPPRPLVCRGHIAKVAQSTRPAQSPTSPRACAAKDAPAHPCAAVQIRGEGACWSRSLLHRCDGRWRTMVRHPVALGNVRPVARPPPRATTYAQPDRTQDSR